jgi:hypothetical protein
VSRQQVRTNLKPAQSPDNGFHRLACFACRDGMGTLNFTVFTTSRRWLHRAHGLQEYLHRSLLPPK